MLPFSTDNSTYVASTVYYNFLQHVKFFMTKWHIKQIECIVIRTSIDKGLYNKSANIWSNGSIFRLYLTNITITIGI